MSDFYKDFDISVSQSVCHQPASMADVLRPRDCSLCHATIPFREALTSFRMVFNRLVAFWIISSPLSFLSRKSFSKSWTQAPQNWEENGVIRWWLKNSPSLSQCWFVTRPPPQFILGFHTARNKAVVETWERDPFHGIPPARVARSDMPNLPPPDRDLRSSCPLGQRGCTSGHSWWFGSAEIKSEREYTRPERTLTLPHHCHDESLFVSMVTQHRSSSWDSRSPGPIPGLQKQSLIFLFQAFFSWFCYWLYPWRLRRSSSCKEKGLSLQPGQNHLYWPPQKLHWPEEGFCLPAEIPYQLRRWERKVVSVAPTNLQKNQRRERLKFCRKTI